MREDILQILGEAAGVGRRREQTEEASRSLPQNSLSGSFALAYTIKARACNLSQPKCGSGASSIKKPKHIQNTWGCVWCGKRPRTGEHLWPQWFSRIVPKTRSSYTNTKTRVFYQPKAVYVQPIIRKRPGDAASLKLKVVCKGCNNGWMSVIEETARHVMTPLFTGSPTQLSQSDQLAIVQWAALKAMIGEYDDEKHTRAIDVLMQQAFYKSRELKGIWKIWIGNYQGVQWKTRYRHSPFKAYSRADAEIKDSISANAQSSIFVGGSLFIHVFSSSNPVLVAFGFRGNAADMVHQIWPQAGCSIQWPPKHIMTDSDVDIHALALSRWATTLTRIS